MTASEVCCFVNGLCSELANPSIIQHARVTNPRNFAIKEDSMHLVVDSEWAKANPRQAAKIQVEYLLWLVRLRNRSCPAASITPEKDGGRGRRKVLSGVVEGM